MTAEQFADRHIGPDPDEQRRMLETVGYGSVDELMDAAIPEVDPLARHPGPAAGRPARPRCSPSCARWPPATPSPCR